MNSKNKTKEKIIIVLVAVIILITVVGVVVISDKGGNGGQNGTGSNGNSNGSSNNNSNGNGGTQNGEHYYDELFAKDIMDIKITMSGDDTFLMWETPSEENYYNCDVAINDIPWKNCAIRVRGKKNTEDVFESGSNKYSYKLDFNEYDNKNEFYKLDGMYLHNMIEDSSYIGQYISFKMMEKLGAKMPYYTLARVQINDEKTEWYFVTEEFNNSLAKRITGKDGTVCLFEANNKLANLSNKDNSANYDVKYGEDGQESYIDSFIAVLNNPESTEADIEAVLDVESVLKAFAVNYVVGNYAGYQGPNPDNFYLLYDNGVMTYFEEDFTGAGGNYRKDEGYSLKVTKDKPVFDVSMDERPLVKVLLERDKYYKMYESYVSKLQDYVKNGDVIKEAKELLGDYVSSEEFKKGEDKLNKYLGR